MRREIYVKHGNYAYWAKDDGSIHWVKALAKAIAWLRGDV